MTRTPDFGHLTGDEIAIVGMAGRFPGAAGVEELWEALVAGREGIVRLGDDELRAAGVSEAELADPRYVKAAPLLAGHDRFDAAFFGYSAVEAEVMDPQQRVLLECAWEALEDAGHDPERYPHPVGVFAGSKTNTYLFHLASKPEVLRGRDVLQLILGGDQALLATRVSYKLDLRGPSYAVQTACSTALVAVHLACRSLLLDECRMALAGGVALNVPHDAGYRYDEGGILSPDGHCRPFDAAAAGTVFGSGAGMVVLKRLADAVADGDRVRAVLLGSATNNDGSGKATFTAPSVEGQTEVVLEALADAGVDARSIGYVEAHGTGTKLGDPIEVLALTNAYRASTAERGFCALGSVKGNLGHLDAAAGMPGLVKTVLALERGLVPKTLHFREPNPALDLAASPFHVAAENLPWPRRDGAPRRAAISSLGFGGTNAHLILEEAPAAEPSAPGRGDQLLVLSARSEAALDAAAERLARRLQADPELPLADVAWTLQVGRRAFEHRRAVVAAGREEAVERLRSGDPAAVASGRRRDGARVVFLFPGQGSQHPGMGRELYDGEEVFRRALDHAAEHLAPRLGLDLREVLFPTPGGEEEAAARLAETALTQPAVFAVEHALARQWMAWGVEPAAMIGHSIGEVVAATLAGVFTVEDALDLVAERGRLMGELPGGAMAAVALPAGEVAALLGDGVEIAAVNATRRTVVTGSDEAVAAFEARLAEALGGAEGEAPRSRRLHTSHAFHSAAMEPVLGRFEEAVARVRRSRPERPWLSNVTGTWITAEEAVDPGYWARHLRRPVRFADGVAAALENPGAVLLEVGPGTTLATFARESAACAEGTPVVPSLPHPRDRRSAAAFFHLSLGRLWAAGVEVDWTAYHAGARRLRVPLPTYPFERQRHWIDLVPGSAGGPAARALEQAGQGAALAVAAEASEPPRHVSLDREPDPLRWLYRPAWRREPGAAPEGEGGGLAGRWLLLGEAATAAPLAERLAEAGARVTLAVPGEGYERLEADRFRLAVDDAKGYDRLLATLAAEGRAPQRVVHLLTTGVGDPGVGDPGAGDPAAAADPAAALAAGRHWQRRAFTSLLLLSQALARRAAGGTELTVVSDRVQPVTGDEPVVAEKAVLLGVVKVLPKEHPEIACRSVDLDADALATEAGLDALLGELAAPPTAVCVALRGGERWVEGYAHLAPGEGAEAGAPPARWPLLRDGGVYLVTGGLGGVGSLLAEQIALGAPGARLVVTGRAALPPREEWDALEPGSPAARRVAAVRRLEAHGAEVVAEAADAADPEAMAVVVRRARQRFGRIDGAVHAAGIAGGGLMQLKTAEAAAAVLDPKVAGGRLLDRLLADGDAGGEAGVEPPFLLLVSSLQTVLGDFGQVDYTGANAFLDALAHERTARGGGATVSLALDNFRDVGLLVEVGLPPHLEPWREELLGKALGSDEAVAAVARALASGRPRVAVSTQDLPARVELSRRLTRTVILRELGQSEAAGSEAPAGPALSAGELTRRVAAVWRRVLSLGDFEPAENFFDLGGDSLSGLQLVSELNRELGLRLAPVELYESPSVAALVARLAPAGPAPAEEAEPAPAAAAAGAAESPDGDDFPEHAVAVVGLAGRFPGAGSVDALWENLLGGVEAVRFFTDEELLAAGVAPERLADPHYVKARPVLAEVDRFDAAFFGYSPRDARILDPQHRLFLEHCWQALEDAGIDPQRESGAIGVFGGSSISGYLRLLWSDPEVMASVGEFQALINNEKDSLTTHTSYKLDLRGPSVAVQTFCSTSLVAIHTACRSVASGECDVALAGGVSVHLPQEHGYTYDPSGGVSRDGHLRAFDAAASGYIFGNGVGVVVLKRLRDALADGDVVRAVVRATAINNDGSRKVGFTATAVEGQAAVIGEAMRRAGVDPASVGYVETHGSGTPLGDPVEVHALNRAFGAAGGPGTVPIGSVKTNLGHLDRASGVAGFITAVLALERGEIPPSLHFDEPNPNIDFAAGPFFVNTERRPWAGGDGHRRRAAVNSLGLGGTNAHAVLEEAPPVPAASASRPWQLLPVSARTETALAASAAGLAGAVEGLEGADLADAAWTLQTGRRAFEHRRVVVARDGAGAAAALRGESAPGTASFTAVCRATHRPPVVFLFPGLGSQYPGMAAGLYRQEAVFRHEVDRCAELLEPLVGADLRQVMWPHGTEEAAAPAGGGLDLKGLLGRGAAAGPDAAAERLGRTVYAQPALFVVEYALARLWESWGVRADALLGYSLGEYVAACVAGVLGLPDALRLVAERARRIQELPPGAMLGVPLTPEALEPYLGDDLSLAAVNGPEQSVAAGPVDAVEALERRLAREGVESRRLQTTHAFHSREMEAVRASLDELVASFELRPPRVPYLSNVTGTWITAEQATDPTYWSTHARQPVQLAAAVTELLSDPDRVLLEVGPGQTLSSLALQCAGPGTTVRSVASVRHAYERKADGATLLGAVGKLWLLGVEPDWRGFAAGERRRKRRLPTYPFERRRFWVDGLTAAGTPAIPEAAAPPAARRFRAPTWKRAAAAAPAAAEAGAPRHWLLLGEPGGPVDALAAPLAAAGHRVTRVHPGAEAAGSGAAAAGADGAWRVAPGDPESFERLLAGLDGTPDAVVHGWCLGAGDAAAPGDALAGAAVPDAALLDRGLRALGHLAAALSAARAAEAAEAPVDLWVVVDGVYDVTGAEALAPARATVLGPCQALPLEVPGLTCRVLETAAGEEVAVVPRLLAELDAPGEEQVVALRGAHRWVPVLEGLDEAPPDAAADEGGAGRWLVLGGDEGTGRRFAEYLAALGAEVVHASSEPGAAADAAAAAGDLAGVVLAPSAAPADGDGGAAVAAAAHLLAAVDGALGERAPVRLLASSLAPGAGGDLAATFARNLLFDAFAHGSARRPAGRWTSVAWDLWQAGDGGTGGAATGGGEALEVFRGLLARAATVPQMLVSARPLERGWNRVARPPAAGDGAVVPEGDRHPRPELAVEYVAPRTEVETAIAGVWQELLGIERIGVLDGFLELGGDSLLASRLATRLRGALDLDLPVRLFFEASSIEELAKAVEAIRGERLDEEMDALFEELSTLSDDEVMAELERRQQAAAVEMRDE